MKKNGIANKEWQKADARVLGQILAAQNIEFALPDTTRIAEFFAETLLAIPGIASCRVCIENVIIQKGEMENELCAGCETLQEITAGQNEIRPRGMDIRCMLAGQANMQINTIDSCQHHFGFFVFRIDDPDAFNVYKPFISNLSNYVAISLENRLQRDLLQKARGELELRVAERTEELKRTNEDLIREIAAHQQAEESLRKSEEELRAFFSQTIDGCFYMMLDEPVRWDETVDKERMLDYVFAHQHITQINDAMLAQYGATREQMMGLTPNDFFKHNLEHGRDLWRRFLDAGKIRLESDERKLDGTSMWIEGEYIAIHDRQGRIIGHFGIQRDITKRKQMDETRREQYSTLHSIIESTDALIFSVDREYRYTSFNSAHAAVMRAIYNVEIQLGHSLWDYMTNAEDREKAKRNLDRALAGEHLVESAYSGEEKLSRLYFEVSHNPIAAGDGTVIGVAVFSHDITKRRRAEEELQEQEMHSQSLLRLSRNLERAQTYTEILNAAQDEVRDIIGYKNLWVYLLTEDKKYCKSLVAGGPISDTVMSEEGTATLTVKGDRMLEEIVEAKGIVVVADAQTDERVNKEIVARLGNRTIVNVPIFLFDRHLGSIGTGTFGDEGVRVPAKSEQAYLAALASHMAAALDRIHLLTERRQAQEALQIANAYNRSLIEASLDPLVTIGPDGKITDVNDATVQVTGACRESLIGSDFSDYFTEPENASAGYQLVLSQGQVRDYPLTIRHRSGKTTDVLYNATIYKNTEGKVEGVFAAARDITERKRAEEERQSHLRFFERMDQVNRTLQGTNDLEQMMGDVLDVVLAIFGCDRAWLLYPCDPEAASWQMPVERTRPEYPGAMALGTEVPMKPEAAGLMRTVLNSSGPVRFDPGCEYPLAEEDAKRFGYRSQISMALYPRTGKPWMFGLHQCSYPRIWTPQEERLLQEIGRRLADALTGLLAYGELRESERQYRLLAENISDVIWILDLETGRFRYVSPSVERLRGYTVEEVLAHDMAEALTPESLNYVMRVTPPRVNAFRRGARETYRDEISQPCRDGSVAATETIVSFQVNEENGHIEALGVSRDITERKRAEEEIARSLEAEKKAREIAEILREANESLSRTLNLDDVLQNLLQYLNRLVPYDSANVMLLEGDFQLRVAALRGYERWTDIDMTRKITFDVRTTPVLKEVVAAQKSLIIADTRDYPGWMRPAGAKHVISWLGVPIFEDSQVIVLYSVEKV